MAPVTSGVPQGSLLGLLMFVLFINDLPDASYGDVNIALYAGDSKIFGAVKCVFTTVRLCKPPFQTWMNGHNITTSNLTPLHVKS